MGGGRTTTTTTGPSPEATRIASEFQLQGIRESNIAAREQLELAIQELQRAESVARADLAPAREAGVQALEQLKTLSGIGADPAAQLEALEQSPGFQFRLQQGTKAVERSAAARGLLSSGANLQALQEFGQQAASQEFGAQQARLAQLAGLGSGALGQSAALASQLGSNIAQGQLGLGQQLAASAQAAGQARASSVPGIHSQTVTQSSRPGLFGQISQGIGLLGAVGGLF